MPVGSRLRILTNAHPCSVNRPSNRDRVARKGCLIEQIGEVAATPVAVAITWLRRCARRSIAVRTSGSKASKSRRI